MAREDRVIHTRHAVGHRAIGPAVNSAPMSLTKTVKWAVAVVAALLVAAACGGDAPADPGTADARRGESTYLVACIACHGSAGEGIAGLGKPLADSDFIGGQTDEELLEFIIVGRSTTDPENTSGIAMPPRGGRPSLNDWEIRDIIAYLRSLQ
jgi:disulfide bond formation protein DsbB